jgi:ribokinase
MSIAVFGSINMDLVARTARLPQPGETLTGQAFQTFPGGKGANQAVACARLEAATYMVGRVGGDVFGTTLIEGLATAGVNHKFVTIDPTVSSGVAVIAVEDSAENFIIVIPGANGQVSESDLENLDQILGQVEILLLQLEIPLPMVVAAAKIAHEKSVCVILDPAPAQALPTEIYPWIDIITPNETEAELLVGFPIASPADGSRAAQVLADWGVANVIVKMGRRGAMARIEGQAKFYPAYPVEAVDTVAAGDTFNGALAAGLSTGLSLSEALPWALAGGALSVTKAGAQTAMPNRDTLLKFLDLQK